MILTIQKLLPGDHITVDADGHLVVYRVVSLMLCRCRECEDRCERLGESPHLTCAYCHNNHSQSVGGVYKGPFRGAVRGEDE